MKNAFIYHNPGLGDHIVLSGAVRYFSERYDNITLLAISDHINNLKVLYSDVKNLEYHPVPRTMYLKKTTCKNLKLHKNHFIQKGFNIHACFWNHKWPASTKKIGKNPNTFCWAESFYFCLGVDYKNRYEKWKIVRNKEREKIVLSSLDINPGDEYLFIVDKHSFGKSHRLKFLKRGRKVVYAGDNFSIFDWMGVIENAAEIHTVDTSWFHLIKQMRLNQPKFYHAIRKVPCINGIYVNDDYDHGWKIIGY